MKKMSIRRQPEVGGMVIRARLLSAVAEVPVERFEAGGWSVDVQFLDLVGSPCLLAHGLGEPQPDAKAEVAFPRSGAWRLWVRTKNWADGAPGRFDVLVDGRRAGKTFGAGERRWAWEDGGLVTVGTRSVVTLRDLTGFDVRCAGLVFSDDPAFVPEGPWTCGPVRPTRRTTSTSSSWAADRRAWRRRWRRRGAA